MSYCKKIALSAIAICIATISQLKTFYRKLEVKVFSIVKLIFPTHYWDKFTKQGDTYTDKHTKQGDVYYDKYD